MLFWNTASYFIPLPTSPFSSNISAKLLFLSSSVMSDSLRPHGLQHARFPCPSLSPRVCSNSCPLSRWCHPTISSSAAPSNQVIFCDGGRPVRGGIFSCITKYQHHPPPMWPSGMSLRDFPGGPVINNPPCNAGCVGSIPGGGTKIPPAEKQLSPGAATIDLEPHNQTVLAL